MHQYFLNTYEEVLYFAAYFYTPLQKIKNLSNFCFRFLRSVKIGKQKGYLMMILACWC